LANGFFVEVDIVLPHDVSRWCACDYLLTKLQMSLREAHDIGQELQDLIEQLDDVERCFVHLDWENDHAPG
jgi:hypothetical protein